jgi:hypothetical protein
VTNAFSDAAAKAAEAARAAQANAPLVDEDDTGDSGLFGGEKLPGLFNKFITPGTQRTGIIVKKPTQRQARDIEGKPKYWDEDEQKVTTVNTGRPLKDSVIVLQTEYRYTEQEIADRNIDPLDVEEDKGLRGIFASGDLKAAIMRAIRVAKVRSEAEMVGMRLTVDRGRKVPIPGTQKTRWEGATATLTRD